MLLRERHKKAGRKLRLDGNGRRKRADRDPKAGANYPLTSVTVFTATLVLNAVIHFVVLGLAAHKPTDETHKPDIRTDVRLPFKEKGLTARNATSII